MLGRLDLAASKGCNGVEPEDVTAHLNRTGFDIELCARSQALGLHTLVLSVDLDDSIRIACDD